MHVSLDWLESFHEILGRLGEVVPLRDIVSRYRSGKSTAGMVALTSDDAYASLLSAEAVLVRRQLPLTVFPVSGSLRSGTRFWWDRLDEAAARTPELRWREFQLECGLPESYRTGPLGKEGPARPLRQWILAGFAGRCPEQVDRSLENLEREIGPGSQQRSMNEQELTQFIGRTGADLGVHTASHPALPFLREDEVVREIQIGYSALASRFPNVLPYLAVPFGLWDARTHSLSTAAGMQAWFTLDGIALPRHFRPERGIPRVCVVRDQTPSRVALKISRLGTILSRIRRGTDGTFPTLPSATS
jgi:peptidoglycan/xylan/chitin deacetylase (PgdA/CDA1 family)